MVLPPELADSPAKIVAAVLSQVIGLGSTPIQQPIAGTWPVYYSNEPSSPDEVITVFDTVGQINSREIGYGRYWTYWGLQIRVRSFTHDDGWNKAQTIRSTLANALTETPPVTEYQVILENNNQYCLLPFIGIGQVIVLGKDTPATKRSLFTLNLMAIISQTN